MSLNSSAAQPPLSPQQQDTGLPAALPPDTPDVANPSEPEQTEPVLARELSCGIRVARKACSVDTDDSVWTIAIGGQWCTCQRSFTFFRTGLGVA